MPVRYKDSKGVEHKIDTTPDEERQLQAGEVTISDLLTWRGTSPLTTNPQEGAGGARRSTGPAPDSVRRWLQYYPGLKGDNNEPNQWAWLLQNTVQEGLKSGKLNLPTWRQLEQGKLNPKQLEAVLQRAQEGVPNPWEQPKTAPQIDSLDVMTAVGQTNPMTLGLYGLNAAMGTSIGEGLLTTPQETSPWGPLAPGQEARVAPLRPAAGLAGTLPLGLAGRAAGAVAGGVVDAGVEGARQKTQSGEITSPLAMLAQGAWGAAANTVPGLGWLGTGGRMARAAKTGGALGAYGAGAQAISNQVDQDAGITPPASPLEAAKYTGLMGAVLGGAPGGVRLQGGTLRDKGVIGQYVDAARARATANQPRTSIGQVPPQPGQAPGAAPMGPQPVGPQPTQPGGGDLMAVNARLRDLANNAQYDSPEYAQLVQEQRRLQVELDQAPKAPGRDVQQQLKQASDELAALQAAGVTSARVEQLKRRVKALGKKAAAAGGSVTPAVAAAQPRAVAAKPVAESGGKIPPLDPSIEAEMRKLHAEGRAIRPEGGPTPEMDALLFKALGQEPVAEGAAVPITPAATPKIPKPPLKPGQARVRIATPFTSAEEMRQKAPKVYRTHVMWMDRLVKQMGYPAAKQWIEAVSAGRDPGLKVGAGKAGQVLLSTTQVLSKSPNHVRLLWGSLGPHYEKQAAALGVVDPVKTAKTLVKKAAGAKAVSPELTQQIKAAAEELGAADVASDAPFAKTPAQAAALANKLKTLTAKGQRLAGWVPPQHKDSPLSVWPPAEIEKAAVAMFQGGKRAKKLTEANRAQVLVAGSRLMERYEKLVASGKDPAEAAQAVIRLGQSGNLKEHRLHAQGMSAAKLQDWLGKGGGQGSLGPKIDTAAPTTTGFGKSIPTDVTPETAFTMAEQSLADRKVARRQNVRGVKKGEAGPDPRGLAKAAKDLPELTTAELADVVVRAEDGEATGWTKAQIQAEATRRMSLPVGQRGPAAQASETPSPKKGTTARRTGVEHVTDLDKLPDRAGAFTVGRQLIAPDGSRRVIEKVEGGSVTLAKNHPNGEQMVVGETELRRFINARAAESDPQPPAGPKLGDKLAAAAPVALFPQDDEDDDTSAYATRLATMGIAAIGGVSLWQRSRKAWRLGGKPVPKLSVDVRPNQVAALVHDDVKRVVEIANGMKKQYPQLAEQIEAFSIADGPNKGAALYVPKALADDQTFTKRFSKTIASMEAADVTEAKAVAPKKVSPAPITAADDAFTQAMKDTAEAPPPDAETGPPADVDEFEAFSNAFKEGDGPGAQGQRAPGWKPKAPILSETEVDVELLDSDSPSAVGRTKSGKFLYDPSGKKDRRILLRDPRALTEYETQLAREGAQRGEVPLPNPGGVKWYSTYEPDNPNHPLTKTLAQIRKEKPFAQARVRQNEDTGKYAIEVNENGFLGPVVRMKRKDDAKVHTGYKADAWGGWAPAYVKAVKEGQVQLPPQVNRVRGHNVLPYEVWSPSEARTVEIPVEGAQGQGYKRQAAGDESKGTTGLVPTLAFTGHGIKTQKVELSNRPVALFKGKNVSQLDKIAGAISKRFQGIKLLTQELPDGQRVLVVDRQSYDGLNRMEREVLSELPQAADPDNYVYRPVQFGERPVGLKGAEGPIGPAPAGPKIHTEAAPDEVATSQLSRTELQRYQQASRQRLALEIERAKETDGGKRAVLDKQIAQLKTLQFRLARGVERDPARTGKLTWKEAKDSGFKVLEVSANETRMAEIRKALVDEFGDPGYQDHFVSRGQKTPGGFKWHIAVSPEFMSGASRLSSQRSAVARERVGLRTGTTPPPPRPPDIIKRGAGRAPVAKDMVEFSNRSGIERGVVDQVSADGKRVWVRMKGGKALIPLDADFVRVVEHGGKQTAHTLPQFAALHDNDLIRPLVAKLTGRPADKLTDVDFDQAWGLLLNDSQSSKRGTLASIRQAYKDQGVEPPAALKAAEQRLQPRGVTGWQREVQDLSQGVSAQPHDVIREVLWNTHGKPPTVKQILTFAKTLDGKLEELMKAGVVDRAEGPQARLVLLQRAIAAGQGAENTDRATQLAQLAEALEEAVGGLPRNPFGDWAANKLPKSAASLKTGSSGQAAPQIGKLPTSVDDIVHDVLKDSVPEMSIEARIAWMADDLIAAKRSQVRQQRQDPEALGAFQAALQDVKGKLGLDPTKPMTKAQWDLARPLLEQDPRTKDVSLPFEVAALRGNDLFGKKAALQRATYKPPVVGDTLPPKPQAEVVRATAARPVTPAVMRSADAVVFYATAQVGRPTRGTKGGALYPLPSGDKWPGRTPVVIPGNRKPVGFEAEWEAAGKLSGKKLTKRVLNPTVSQLQTLLSAFSPVTGETTRRTPRIVVIGDDGGKVDFALASQRVGAKPLFDEAIKQAKASLGVKPDAKLTPDQWKQVFADPKNWRLLSILPAMAAGAAEAEAATGDDRDPDNSLRKYLPTLITLGLVAGGAKAWQAYRNRPIVPKMPTGPTAIEGLAAQQKTKLAEHLRPTPVELSFNEGQRVLQDKYNRLGREQKKHAPGSLLPGERAMDTWAQQLGGGGGMVDAAVIRIDKTLKQAKAEGLSDALVNELNIRGAERVQDTLTQRVIDTENRVTTLRSQVKALNTQLAAADTKTAKLTLGKQRSLALRQLSRARRRLATVGKAMAELHAGKRLPGGLTPSSLAAEKAALTAQGRAGGRVSQLAERVYQEARQVMDRALAEGVIPKSLYNDVVSKDKGYVNLKRWFDHVQTTRVGRLRQAFGPNAALDVPTDRILRHLEGSDALPQHPVQAMTMFLRSANQELVQQKATRSLVELMRKDPANMVRRVSVDVDGNVVGKDLAYVQEHDLRPVTYLVDGLPVHYAVPSWAAQLAEVAGSSPVESNAFFAMLGRARGWSQASMTSLQAPFQFVNAIRDIKSAGQLTPEAYKRLDPVDTVKRYVDWGKSLAEVWRRDPDYLRFLEDGAAYSTFTKGLDPQLYQDILDDSLLGESKGRTVLRTIQQATSAVEEATKLMTWKRLRDQGMGSLDRATLTRNFGGSPDFWKQGDWSRGLGTMLLFFNPAIQGVAQTVSGIRKHGKFLIPAALGAAAMNHSWNSQFVNDQGELDLYDVDPNVRANNHVFLKPWKEEAPNGQIRREYWAIPKSHVSQLIYGPIEAAMEARERGGVDIGKTLNALAAKLLPVTSESFEMERPTSLVEGVAASIIPPFRLPAELLADRRLYGDRPIEGKAFENVRKSERYRDSTGMLFRDIGKAVGKVQSLGGEPGEGLSPLKLEYGARSMFPGPVDALSDTYDSVGGLFGREVPSKPGGRIPLLSSVARRFTGPQYEGARITEARNQFYADLERARKDQRVGAREGIAPYAKFLEKQAMTLAKWRKQRQVLEPKAKAGDQAARRSLTQLITAEQKILAAARRVVNKGVR